jgi:hypothetical protein
MTSSNPVEIAPVVHPANRRAVTIANDTTIQTVSHPNSLKDKP